MSEAISICGHCGTCGIATDELPCWWCEVEKAIARELSKP